MRIVIQAFNNDDDTKGLELRGDSVAEVKTFEDAREVIEALEKNGI